ncbi:MAG: phosphate/phosphite/phosphonate ABC transporter substrate-binding protein [Actinomycetota bacterium]
MGTQAPLIVGAVAYHERVVPIWENFREYFAGKDAPIDYVLYSNYERLVEALLSGRVDVAWNTNTAFVKARHASVPLVILGMRDIDTDYASVVVTRRSEGFEKAPELAGKRLALGSRDSGHAAILPLYYLLGEGLDAVADCELIRFDTDLGKHGDTGDSELRVVRAVAESSADAGALGAPTWARLRAEATPATQDLEVQWKSPLYYHCNFTALESIDQARAQRWQKALLDMSYDDPARRHAMDLEGVKQWHKGDESGYRALELAMQEQDYL